MASMMFWAVATLTTWLTVVGGAPASSNNSSALPADFGQIEVQYREAVGKDSFLVDINDASQSSGYQTQYGSIRYVIGQSNEALFTLPSNGLAQQAVQLQGCAVWTPHYHPRASEILYVTKGTLQMAFSEENEVTLPGNVTVGGKTWNYTVGEQQSLIVPQGLMHYVYNPSCDAASITTFFDNKDPGIVSVTGNVFSYDTSIISATTGLRPLEVSLATQVVQATKVIAQDTDCANKCPAGTSAHVAAAAPPEEGTYGMESAKAAAPAAAPAAG